MTSLESEEKKLEKMKPKKGYQKIHCNNILKILTVKKDRIGIHCAGNFCYHFFLARVFVNNQPINFSKPIKRYQCEQISSTFKCCRRAWARVYHVSHELYQQCEYTGPVSLLFFAYVRIGFNYNIGYWLLK